MASNEIQVKYTLDVGARAPYRATAGSACVDLHAHDVSAAFDGEGYAVHPGDVVRIGTGVRVAIPGGYEGLIRPRSGLALKGLDVHPGTIDSDYRGEVAVILRNVGTLPVKIGSGDRIAQLAVRPAPSVELVEGWLDATERGNGGFGSTGQ